MVRTSDCGTHDIIAKCIIFHLGVEDDENEEQVYNIHRRLFFSNPTKYSSYVSKILHRTHFSCNVASFNMFTLKICSVLQV